MAAAVSLLFEDADNDPIDGTVGSADRTVLGLTSGDIPVDGVKELEEVPHFEARSPTMEPFGQSSLASRGSGDSGPTALAR